jgi:ribosomal protein S18 acetylase RimI-like enzyme
VPHDDRALTDDPPRPGLPEDDWPPLTSRVDGVTVRYAREEDHAAIAHLTVASYVDGGHVHPEDAYIEHLQDVTGRASLARVLVGEVEVGEGMEARTVVAGSVVLTLPGMPMSETARDGEFEFRMLAVDPSVQRRGVARALVRAAIDRAGQLEGIEAVVLTTMETMTSAHRLYESEGFVRVPERDWRLSDIGQEPTDGTDQLYWVFRRPV